MYIKIQNLVIKCASYNGEPYIPTITGSIADSGTRPMRIIKNLYVPEENIDLYRQQYNGSFKIVNILPLSESPY